MTWSQARQVIQQAERDPSSVTDEQLAEARQVAGQHDQRWVDRAARAQEKKEELGRAELPDMTAEQARRYIQQAERTGKWTKAKLEEAVEVLTTGSFNVGTFDFGYVRRAQNLLDGKTDEFKPGSGPGRESAPLPPGRQRGGDTPQERMAKLQGNRTPAIPANLVNRFFQAAARAGIDRAEARQLLDEYRQTATAGFPPEVIAAYEAAQAAGQPVPPLPEPPSIEELVNGQIAEWMQGTIGVPDDFIAVRDEEIPVNEGLERFRQERGIEPTTRQREVLPRYRGGDEWNMASLSPERVVEVQRQLEAAGLLGEGSSVGPYYAGVWDSTTAAAMTEVLTQANASGTTWEQALSRMVATVPQSVKEERARRRAEEAMAGTFIAPAYLKPDPAQLSQSVKAKVRAELGREPTDEEMAELAGVMSQSYRSEYEAEVAAMRAEFDAMKGYEEQIMADIAAGGTGEGIAPPGSVGSFQGVDPQARFAEAFDRRFAPELDFIEGQADQVRNANNVFSSIVNMSRLVG